MADREDFATEVGELIKGRSPVGHNHTRLDTAGASLLLDAAGGVQHFSGGVRKFRIDETGTVLEGIVPWERVGGKPLTFPPAAHTHTQIENGTAATRLNSAGGLQHLVDEEIVTEFDSTGTLTRGTVGKIHRPSVNKELRFDAVGRLQYFDTSTNTILFQISPNGQVTLGTVPWDRITGAPPIPSGQIPDPVSIPGPLGPLFTRLAHADTVTVPLLFVGSSTTRRDYPKNLVSRIASAYPSGGGEYGTVYADVPLGSRHTGPGVAGYNAGRGGNTAADYVDAPILGNAALVQPVAIFHGIGSNDWANNVPPATFEANVRAAIAAIDAQVTVPHVHVLMQQHTRTGSRTYAWSDYTAALRRIAEGTTDRVFVDLGPAIDRADPLGADPFGYGAGDGTHMNLLGEEALAELMARALGIPGGHSGGSQNTGWRSLSLAAGWSGRLLVRRIGVWVKVIFDGVTPAAGATGTAVIFPVGLRPSNPSGVSGRLMLHTTSGAVRRGSYGGSPLTIVGAETGVALYGEVDLITDDLFPTLPPGSPA